MYKLLADNWEKNLETLHLKSNLPVDSFPPNSFANTTVTKKSPPSLPSQLGFFLILPLRLP